MAFDANRSSVPRPWAFRAVTVKGDVDRVVVTADGRVIAEHPRSYDRSVQVLDPVHYLATLERRPAALDHAPVYRDWEPTARWPDCVASWRAGMGRRGGRASSSACCHCWPSTRSRGLRGRSTPAVWGMP